METNEHVPAKRFKRITINFTESEFSALEKYSTETNIPISNTIVMGIDLACKMSGVCTNIIDGINQAEKGLNNPTETAKANAIAIKKTLWEAFINLPVNEQTDLIKVYQNMLHLNELAKAWPQGFWKRM